MSYYYEAAPFVRSLFSGPMEAEVLKGLGRPGQPTLWSVLEVDAPAPVGKFYACSTGVVTEGSSLPAIYRNIVQQFGTSRFYVSEKDSRLNATEVEVLISDQTREFERLATSYPTKLRGAPAAIRWLSPNVPRTMSFSPVVGVLDSWSRAGGLDWTLRIRSNDRPILNGEAPRVPYTVGDFPNLSDDAKSVYAALIYGEQNSVGLGDNGAVRAQYVDTVGFRYAWGLGPYELLTVYDDGAPLVSPPITTPIINGKQFTLFDSASDLGSSVITADLYGFKDTAGMVIRNPALQMQHFIANFVYNDWRSGPFFDPRTVPIDVDLFASAAAYCEALAYEGARVIRDLTDIDSILNAWAEEVGFKLFWTNEGKLGIALVDLFCPFDIYEARQWVRGSELAVDELDISPDTTQLTRSIKIDDQYIDFEGKFKRTIVMSDLRVPDKVSTSRTLYSGPARVI